MSTDIPADRLPVWRFSLEDISPGVRSGFADKEILIAPGGAIGMNSNHQSPNLAGSLGA